MLYQTSNLNKNELNSTEFHENGRNAKLIYANAI